MTTPLSVYLPFNREVLGADFEPAKRGGAPPAAHGHWLLVQDQELLVVPDGGAVTVPGTLPAGLETAVAEPFWLGTLRGEPCWTAAVPKDSALPPGLERQTLVPMRGTKLPDELLSLGGMAMQALWWQGTSAFCPRCGEATSRIEGEWGKQCPRCKYEHYPHLHPAVIIMVRDGDRVLLARKAEWAPGRYALVAGFVATYAGGELRVDHSELEDARWFPGDALPNRPSRHSIAGFIMQHYANPSSP